MYESLIINISIITLVDLLFDFTTMFSILSIVSSRFQLRKDNSEIFPNNHNTFIIDCKNILFTTENKNEKL